MKKEINKLNKWLEKNLKSKLAYLLGYQDSQTIDNWVKRGNIPSYQLPRVLKIIEQQPEEK